MPIGDHESRKLTHRMDSCMEKKKRRSPADIREERESKECSGIAIITAIAKLAWLKRNSSMICMHTCEVFFVSHDINQNLKLHLHIRQHISNTGLVEKIQCSILGARTLSGRTTRG